MKNKLTTLLLAIFMVIPIVGCGDPDLDTNPGANETKILLEFAEREEVETDVFDATSSKDDKGEAISEAQVKRLFILAKGKDTDKVKSIIEKHGFKQSKDITKSKYNDICEAIEKLEATVGA